MVIDQLQPQEAQSIQTRKGHTFFAYDVQHTFRTEFVIHAGQGQEQFLHITGVNGSATAGKTLTKFINVSPTSMVHINYLNTVTQEEQLVIENLRPREDRVLETHSGHQFVAYDEAQTFRKVFTMTVDKGMMERHLIDLTARTCEYDDCVKAEELCDSKGHYNCCNCCPGLTCIKAELVHDDHYHFRCK